jgi:MOSC domain-containing protein YiiM
LQGDQQADLSVHGGPDKAVYVYSWDNTLYWRQQLQREDLGPGSFGENFTVEELLDDEVAIGDELEAGTARFQVTQPRLPCFKLVAKMGLPHFLNVFLESGRTGFYLRVLKEGFVTAGDSITRIEVEASRRVTISEFTKLFRDHEASDDLLERISNLKALPEKWKDWLRHKFPSRLSFSGASLESKGIK